MRCEAFGDALHRVLALNLARLAAVKSKYDSDNVFRVNQTSCRPRDAARAVTPLLICFCCRTSAYAKRPRWSSLATWTTAVFEHSLTRQRMWPPIAAVHESGSGTKRTSRPG